MHHFVTHNEETKASIVERFNKTEDAYVVLFHETHSLSDTSTSCRPLCDRTTTPITAVSVWHHRK